MKLVKLACPNCNANLEIEETREFAFCTYCGTKIAIQKDVPLISTNKVIINNGVFITDNTENNNEAKPSIENLILRAEDFFKKGKIDDAIIYFNRVLDIDIHNERANNGLIAAEIQKALNFARTVVPTAENEQIYAKVYIEVLKIDPDNAEAIQALDTLKKMKDEAIKNATILSSVGCLIPSLLITYVFISLNTSFFLIFLGIALLLISIGIIFSIATTSNDCYNTRILREKFKK